MLLPALLAAFALPAAQTPFDPDPERTAHRWLVIYNANWPDEDGNGINDSEEVARHWAALRGVTADNVLGVACSTGTSEIYSGQTGWEAFWDEMVTPIRNKILNDSSTYTLGFLFCYGVPIRITPPGFSTRGLDTTLISPWNLGDRTTPFFFSFGSPDTYFDAAPGVGTDPGRFDPASFLELGHRTYLVARLDGVDKQHAMELVDMALYGDAYLSTQPGHYSGTAYCDTRFGLYSASDLAGYPFGHWTYASADKDMAYGRDWMPQAGFPLRWEPYGTEIGESGALWSDGTPADSAPDAMVYEGWYNYRQYFDVWTWKVGSMACDLNSDSVAHMRDPVPGTFLGSALQRGLTCGPGVIAEPYLNGHPYPEIFVYYMLAGYPFGEAARVSDSKLKWTNIYVGDPLYQPFRVGKVPILDTTPPPPATIESAAYTGTPGEWAIAARLDNLHGALPDLGTMELRFGPDPSLLNSVPGADSRPRIFQNALLSALPADAVTYYRADFTDPVGNIGLGTTYVLHTGLENRPVVARLHASSTSVPVGTPFTIELALGASDGFRSLTSYQVTLTATHMGLDHVGILNQFLGPDATLYDAPDGTLEVSRLLENGTLSVGTYLIEVSASSPAGSDGDSLTINVY